MWKKATTELPITVKELPFIYISGLLGKKDGWIYMIFHCHNQAVVACLRLWSDTLPTLPILMHMVHPHTYVVSMVFGTAIRTSLYVFGNFFYL